MQRPAAAFLNENAPDCTSGLTVQVWVLLPLQSFKTNSVPLAVAPPARSTHLLVAKFGTIFQPPLVARMRSFWLDPVPAVLCCRAVPLLVAPLRMSRDSVTPELVGWRL